MVSFHKLWIPQIVWIEKNMNQTYCKGHLGATAAFR